MIVPTPRLLLAALAGIIPIVLLPGHGAALVAAAIWLIGAGCLAFADSRLVPLAGLMWEREYEGKLSLGAPNPITLRLSNRSRRPIEYRVRDAVPEELPSIGNEGTGRCMPAEETTLRYRVTPVHRGDYALGPLTARYLGPLGLAWRQRSYDLGSCVQVYPDLRVIRTYEMLLRRGHLHEIGLHASRRWGMGTEFERLREYTTDDEFRRINWPATARRHKPIAVDYETERSQNVVLALDAGRLMGVEIAPREGEDEIPVGGRMLTRLDYAVNASLLQAFVAAQYGDRTGLLVFSDHVTRFAPPRSGRGQFLALTDMLYDVQAEPVEADFAVGLGYLAARSP
ncbi:MAG TPA: DUF58 domain-containing protein, partial [Chloroflexota bacterium]